MNLKIQSLLLFPSGGQKQPVLPFLPHNPNLVIGIRFFEDINFSFLLKAKLMFMPVHGSYLAAVIAILVFVLLLLLQTDLLASNNRYL